MKTTRLLVLLIAVALSGCAVGTGVSKPPTHVGISGAKALYLQSSTTTRSVTRTVVTASAADLMAVQSDNSTSTVTWTASDGSTVTATVNKALALDSTHLLIAYTYSTTSETAILDTTSGNLIQIAQIPDNWDRVRVIGATAYYISGGAVYTLNISTAATTARTSADAIPADSYLFLSPGGGILTLSSSERWFYPASGARVDLSGVVGAVSQLYSALTDSTALYVGLVDASTGSAFLVTTDTGALTYRTISIADSPAGYVTWSDPPTVLDSSTSYGRRPVWYGGQYLDSAVMVDASAASHIVRFASNGAGGITATVSTVPAPAYAYVYQDAYDLSGSALYGHGSAASGGYAVVKIDISTAPATGETLATSPDDITSAVAAGGQVFFTTSTATYQVDEATKVVTDYSTTPVSIEGVQ